MKKKYLIAGFIVSSCAILTGCVDESYDLEKDIDLTVTIGGDNLTFPIGSTESITLKKIFDLNEDEENTLKSNKGEISSLSLGDYYLKEDAAPTETYIDIQSTTVKLGEEIEEKETLTFINPQLAGIEEVKLLTKLNTKYQFHNEDIPSQLQKINWLEIEEPTHLNIYFDAQGKINYLTIKEGLTITFPEYITLETYDGDFYHVEGHNIIVTQDKPFDASGAKIDFNIVKIDFTHPSVNEDFFKPSTDPKDLNNTGVLDLDVTLNVRGEIAAKSEDFQRDVLTGDATIGAKISFDDAIVKRGSVQIVPNFNVDVQEVDFVDVPDFLDDEDTNIDLYDPHIFLYVNNPSPIGVNITADLVALDEYGNTIFTHNGNEAKIHVGNSNYDAANALYIPAEKEVVFAISRRDHTYGPDTVAIVINNINDLVEKIPAKISVQNVESSVPPIDYIIELGKRHTVTAGYEFITPLAFGDHLNFVYKDNVEGWNEDLEDIQIKCVEVEMTTINEIPMEMSLEAHAVNNYGNEISNVTVNALGKINAGKKGQPAEGTIKLTFYSADGKIDHLDGINFVITGKSPATTAGTPLNENQTLQLTNMKLRIKEGVTMDLN